MFQSLKEKFSSTTKRMDGRTDYLEAVCAASALIAAADGEIEDDEVEATLTAVKANDVLNGSFNAVDIEKCMATMLQRAEGGRAGRAGLMKEIQDIASNKKEAEMVLYVALDIADSDGEREPEENAVLERVAKTLGLKLADYDV